MQISQILPEFHWKGSCILQGDRYTTLNNCQVICYVDNYWLKFQWGRPTGNGHHGSAVVSTLIPSHDVICLYT